MQTIVGGFVNNIEKGEEIPLQAASLLLTLYCTVNILQEKCFTLPGATLLKTLLLESTYFNQKTKFGLASLLESIF